MIDYTMSPDLIRGWIKKVRPFLYCEKNDKSEYKQALRSMISEAKEQLKKRAELEQKERMKKLEAEKEEGSSGNGQTI